MKPYPVSPSSLLPINPKNLPPLEPGSPPPDGVAVKWLPRIRCWDCTTKLYTALPGRVETDFEVHLRNKLHRENVRVRMAKEGEVET